MPITYDEAYAKTNPELNENQRKDAARAIMAGVAANDAYWQHTDELTRLKAHANGHGEVPEVTPTSPLDAIESTASEDTHVTGDMSDTAAISAPTTSPAESTPTDSDGDTIAKLRKQIADSGAIPAA